MRPAAGIFFRLMILSFFCALLAPFPSPAAAPATGMETVNIPWDWSGIIGTGQSLAVGDHGRPIESTNQPYRNLKLSTADLPWPVNPDDTNLCMVPLIEPVGRLARGYPSSWPDNISGETPHSTMGNEISALVMAASGRDFISVHGEVGENGQCMTFLKKNAIQMGVPATRHALAVCRYRIQVHARSSWSKISVFVGLFAEIDRTRAGNPTTQRCQPIQKFVLAGSQ